MTVILVHGIMDDGRIFETLQRALEAAGHRVIAPSLHPASGATGLEALAAQVADVIAAVPEPEPIDLVGFSMGALISRYVIAHLDPKRRVRRFFSISGPHGGSLWAHLPLNRGTRQMRPGSAFLADLDAHRKRLVEMPVYAYWSPMDLTVVPARSAGVDFGENHRIPALLHSGMVRHPRLIAHCLAVLAEAPPV